MEETTHRVKRLDAQIQALVPDWSQAALVKVFTAHRGVSLLTAATIVAELGELNRFDRARDLMGFVGLVPSLNASGQRHHKGSITKTGNAHVRRVLTEAAWAYRHPTRRSPWLRRRLKDQPEVVRQLAWKAQVRLCGRYRRMRARGKQQNSTRLAHPGDGTASGVRIHAIQASQ